MSCKSSLQLFPTLLSNIYLICLGAVGFLLAVFFLLPSSLEAQTQEYKPAAEKLFERGLEAYKEGRYKNSQVHMLQIMDIDPNQRSSAAIF